MFKSWWTRKAPRRKLSRTDRPTFRRLGVENLEDRRLLAITFTADPAFTQNYTEIGPGLITNPTNLTNIENVANGNSTAGAVQAVLSDPNNFSIIYAGTVNGGVFKTVDGGNNWVPLTDHVALPGGGFAGLSIGALAMDKTNSSIIYAGLGRTSSANAVGGTLDGLLKTTDGGLTWTQVGAGLPTGVNGLNITSIAVNGQDILLGADTDWAVGSATSGHGIQAGGEYLYYSSDGGNTFTPISTAIGRNGSEITDIKLDPANPNSAYVAMIQSKVGGGSAAVLQFTFPAGTSTPTAANFVDLSVPGPVAYYNLATLPTANDVKLGIFDSFGVLAIYVAVSAQGFNPLSSESQLQDIYEWQSNVIQTQPSPVGNWRALATPFSAGDFTNQFVFQTLSSNNSLNTNLQGLYHLSIAVDPFNPDIVYIGGDSQPDTAGVGFPNSVGASSYSGRFFVGTVPTFPNPLPPPNPPPVPPPATWTQMTDNAVSAGDSPSSGARTMLFDNTNRLLVGTDRGLFVRTNPSSSTSGNWTSLNGNVLSLVGGLHNTEITGVSQDTFSNVVLASVQNNGVVAQTSNASQVWQQMMPTTAGADAIDFTGQSAIGVDNRSSAVQSTRYFSLLDGGAYTATRAGLQKVNGFYRQSFNGQGAALGPATPLALQVTNAGVPAGVFLNNTTNPPNGAPFDATWFNQTVNGASTPVTNIPFALDTLQNGINVRMVFGTDFLYESMDGGQTVVSLTGVNAIGNAPLAPTFNNTPVLTPFGTFNPVLRPGLTNYGNISAIGYGGSIGVFGNPDVLWVGSSAGVFLRPIGPPFVPPAANSNYPQSTAYVPGTIVGGVAEGAVTGLVVNPNDWRNALVTDVNNNVWMTTDMGNTWALVTGTGAAVTFSTSGALSGVGTIHGIQFVPGPAGTTGDDSVVVGTDTGVYRMFTTLGAVNGLTGQWNFLGAAPGTSGFTTLPNTIVTSINYSPINDTLVVGTLGRGVWTYSGLVDPNRTGYQLTVTGDPGISGSEISNSFNFVLNSNPNLLDVSETTGGPLAGVPVNTALSVPFIFVSRTDVIGPNYTDLNTGSGPSNSLTIDFITGAGNPIAGRTFTYDGGIDAGQQTNSITILANASYTLSNSSVSVSTASTPILFSPGTPVPVPSGFVPGPITPFNRRVQIANLNANNVSQPRKAVSFTINDWTGSGSLTGSAVAGQLTTLNVNTSQVTTNLSTTNLTFSSSLPGGLNLAFANQQIANLVASGAATTFNVTSWNSGLGTRTNTANGGNVITNFNFAAGTSTGLGGFTGVWNIQNGKKSGATGAATMFVDDSGQGTVVNYDVTPTDLLDDAAVPRPYDFHYNYLSGDNSIRNLIAYGTTAVNRFYVSPAANTQFQLNQTSPVAGNDALSITFWGTTGRTQTTPYLGNQGAWTFTSQTQPIIYNNMNAASINGVTVAAVSGGASYLATTRPSVQVYDDQSGELMANFFPYPAGYNGSVQVSSYAIISGTGTISPSSVYIVTAPGAGITKSADVAGNVGGQVKVFSLATILALAGTPSATPVDMSTYKTGQSAGAAGVPLVQSVFPYGQTFLFGVSVAVGGIVGASNAYTSGGLVTGSTATNVTQVPDIVVAPQLMQNSPANPVRDYKPVANAGTRTLVTAAAPGGNLTLARSFQAYESTFAGGVVVAVGNVNGVGHADIVTAPLSGSSAIVRIYNGDSIASGAPVGFASNKLNNLIGSWLALPSSFKGGVSLAVGATAAGGSVTPDIIVGAGPGIGGGAGIQQLGAGLGAQQLAPQVQIFSGINYFTRGGGASVAPNTFAPYLVPYVTRNPGIVPAGTLPPGARVAAFNPYLDAGVQAAGVRVTADNNLGDGSVSVITAQGVNGKSGTLLDFRFSAQFQIFASPSVNPRPFGKGGIWLG
jgi:hypothetical protein